MKQLTKNRRDNSHFTSGKLTDNCYHTYVKIQFCSILFVNDFHFRISDADGQMRVTEVATRPLVQDLLNHDVSR